MNWTECIWINEWLNELITGSKMKKEEHKRIRTKKKGQTEISVKTAAGVLTALEWVFRRVFVGLLCML